MDADELEIRRLTSADVYEQLDELASVLVDCVAGGASVSYMAPFGGYKRSGLGRESGQDAIQEYMQTKTVWVSTATEVPNPFVMR